MLIGAWAAAPLAGEWIHRAAPAVEAQIPLEVRRDTAAQLPIVSDDLKGVERLDA